jgi:hypothetical protein
LLCQSDDGIGDLAAFRRIRRADNRLENTIHSLRDVASRVFASLLESVTSKSAFSHVTGGAR